LGPQNTKEEFLHQASIRRFANANLAGFLVPSEVNPLFHGAGDSLRGALGIVVHDDTPSYFLGWGILAFAVIGFVRLWKDKYLFSIGILGIIALGLSLGTVIRLGQTTILANKFTPFFWLSRLPFLGMIDCPIRFPIATQLSVAVLSTVLGYRLLTKSLRRNIFIGFMLILFFAEYGTAKMKTSKTFVPFVYEKIAKDVEVRTLLELPSGILESKGGFGNDWANSREHNRQMYWQTVYQKPKIGGYISRVSNRIYDFYKHEPIISDLFTMTSPMGEWSNKNYSASDVHWSCPIP
jgi:hypothetical protein